MAAIQIGILFGFDNYLHTYSLSRSFNSCYHHCFAVSFHSHLLIFHGYHKFTLLTINAVVLLTVGAAALRMHTRTDKPVHGTHKQNIITKDYSSLGVFCFTILNKSTNIMNHEELELDPHSKYLYTIIINNCQSKGNITKK